ncbi:hypothetical protein KGY63_03800, partial [Candidatus Bipolaricaulota bacterium]|nr:hypothetical protein [Candidatus Bipolaricaulota bacterium]
MRFATGFGDGIQGGFYWLILKARKVGGSRQKVKLHGKMRNCHRLQNWGEYCNIYLLIRRDQILIVLH